MFNVTLYNPQHQPLGDYRLDWSPAHAAGAGLVKAQILQPHSPGWGEAASLVHNAFNQAYNANITLTYPQVLGIYVKNNEAASGVSLAVAAGFRGAEQGPLFLERYLPRPIESYFDCDRRDIIEMGSLASQAPGYADLLYSFLASRMKATGRRVAVITASARLLTHLKRLGLTPLILGPARLDMLPPAEQDHWGDYYSTQPQVCAFTAADIPVIERKMRVQFIPLAHQPQTSQATAYALA